MLAGRLGLAVFPIGHASNVAPTLDLASPPVPPFSASRPWPHRRGAAQAEAPSWLCLSAACPPDISASCRSTNAVFIDSMGAVRLDGSACVSICSGDARRSCRRQESPGSGSRRCATSLTTVPGDSWGAAPGMDASGVATSERFVFSSCGLAGSFSEIVAISGGGEAPLLKPTLAPRPIIPTVMIGAMIMI